MCYEFRYKKLYQKLGGFIMDIRELRYIMEIAQQKNMTRAASHLYISQPALSKVVKKIESELGVTLFFRDGASMSLTDAGAMVIKWAEQIMKDVNGLQIDLTKLKHMECGHVTFGIPPVTSVLDFPYVISRFHQNFPKVSLQVYEAGARTIEQLVLDGKIDVGISMRPVLEQGLNELLLLQDQIVCIVPNTHLFASKSSISLNELDSVPINIFPSDFAVHQYLLKQFSDCGLRMNVNITSPTSEFLLQLSQMMETICIMPAPIVNHYDCSNITMIPFEPQLPWELCMVFRKNAFISDPVKALIAHVQSSIIPPLMPQD